MGERTMRPTREEAYRAAMREILDQETYSEVLDRAIEIRSR